MSTETEETKKLRSMVKALTHHVVDLRNGFAVRSQADEEMLRASREMVRDAERIVARWEAE